MILIRSHINHLQHYVSNI